MARKSSNQAPEFVPSSDDKSENFDYLAQSSDILPVPETESAEPAFWKGFDENGNHIALSKPEEDAPDGMPSNAGQTLRDSITSKTNPVRDSLLDLAAEVNSLQTVVDEKYNFSVPDFDDNDVIILTPDWSYFRSLLAACSRFDGQTYEPGQWGNRKFTLVDVWCICYRVDFPATDKDIETQVKTLVKKGILVKEGTGRWSANPILQTKSEALGIAEKKHTKHERNL